MQLSQLLASASLIALVAAVPQDTMDLPVIPLPTDVPTNVAAIYSQELSLYSQLFTNTALLQSLETEFGNLATNTALLLSLEGQYGSLYTSDLAVATSLESADLASLSSLASSILGSASSVAASVVASATAATASPTGSHTAASAGSSSSSHGAAPTARAVEAAGMLAAAGMAGVFLL